MRNDQELLFGGCEKKGLNVDICLIQEPFHTYGHLRVVHVSATSFLSVSQEP